MTDIKVVPDAASLALEGAEQFVKLAAESIEARGRFYVALSGGSTPKAMFGLLASEQFAGRIDWSQVFVFWGDERNVPPDDPDSNYKMASDALLSKVPVPENHIHRIKTELEPTEAAKDYATELKTAFPGDPQFDLILLGMGDDGHTASLFPGTDAIQEKTQWVIGHYVSKLQTWRITLTPVILNMAYHVTFLVAGANKAEVLSKVIDGPHNPTLYPSQIVKPTRGHLLWMIDQAASNQLSQFKD